MMTVKGMLLLLPLLADDLSKMRNLPLQARGRILLGAASAAHPAAPNPPSSPVAGASGVASGIATHAASVLASAVAVRVVDGDQR